MAEIQEHSPQEDMPPVRSFAEELKDWERLQEQVEPGKFVVVTSDGTRKFGSKAELMKTLLKEGPEETVH